MVPVDAGALEPHLDGRAAADPLRRGRRRAGPRAEARRRRSTEALVSTPAGEQRFSFPFARTTTSPTPWPRSRPGSRSAPRRPRCRIGRPSIRFSRLRGERLELGDGVVLVNDCYNANPVSMRAALDHLGSLHGRGAADRGARRDGGARPRGSRAPPRGRRARARGGGRAAGRGRRAGPRLRARPARRRPDRGGGAARAAARAAATRCWSRARGRRGWSWSPRRFPPCSRSRGWRADGRGPDRRHGGDADLHLPGAEVHRVPAAEGVRPAHPRGGPAGAPRQGRHADDGRADRLRVDLRSLPGALGPRRREHGGVRRRDCSRRRSGSPTTS